jgi:predicted site-specific integrase-resolvase
MSLREAERKSQRILSFKDWCALNSISEATDRRIIRAGNVRVTQLSERRIGIGENDNADFQARCARGGALRGARAQGAADDLRRAKKSLVRDRDEVDAGA